MIEENNDLGEGESTLYRVAMKRGEQAMGSCNPSQINPILSYLI